MKEAVNMKEKNPWLAPSCASLKPWLYQIGMTEFSGEQEDCLLYTSPSPRD